MHKPYEVGLHHRDKNSDILWARIFVPGLEAAVVQFAKAHDAVRCNPETRIDEYTEYWIEFEPKVDARGLEGQLVDALENSWASMKPAEKS